MPIPSLPPSLLGLSPWVRLVHDFSTSVNFRLPSRCINDHALLYFHAGNGQFRCGDATWRIEPGTLAIMRPNREHEFWADPDTSFHMYNIHFDLRPRPDSANTQFHRNGLPRELREDEILLGDIPEFLRVARPQVYREHFLVALHAFSSSSVASRLQVTAAVISLVAEISAQILSPQANAADHAGLERAIRMMHEKMGKALTLAELVQVSGLGRSRFVERFHQRYGSPPMVWLRQLRLDTARQDLLYRDLPIKDVAERCGFANVHHFTRAFAAVFGQPPARFRASLGPDVQTKGAAGSAKI